MVCDGERVRYFFLHQLSLIAGGLTVKPPANSIFLVCALSVLIVTVYYSRHSEFIDYGFLNGLSQSSGQIFAPVTQVRYVLTSYMKNREALPYLS